MRKGQLTILKKAKDHHFSEELIDFLSDETLSLQDLNICYNYIYGQQEYPSKVVLSELIRCLNWHKDTNIPLDLLLPCRDLLIGRKEKRRIVRYLQFTWDMKDPAYTYEGFYHYRFMLGQHIPPLWISRLCKKGHDWLISQLIYHPFLREDLVYNDERSLVAGLYRKDSFLYFSDAWESWYDTETHVFPFVIPDDVLCDKECQYAFLNEQACMQSPLFQKIRNFMDNNCIKEGEVIRKLRHPEQEEAVSAAQELLQTSMTIRLPAYSIQCQINAKRGGWINLSIRKTSQIHIGGNKDAGWTLKSADKNDQLIELFLTPDDHIYIKQKIHEKKRYIPLSAQEFFKLKQEEGLDGDLLQLILDEYANKYPFYRDFKSDCKDGCLIPVAFHEIKEYHSRADFLERRYNLANKLRVNWNRRNLNLSYMIIKAYPKVAPGKSREILTQLWDEQLLISPRNCYNNRYLRVKVSDFLTNLLYGKICKSPEKPHDPVFSLSNDYLRMASKTNVKPRLDIYTTRQLEKQHDAISEAYYRKHTAPVHIPKDTKFKALRKLLPPEFEWIKTRKRLIEETTMQHHCVWSYADLITSDTCAIYSFLDKDGTYSEEGVPRRYTMEFRMHKSGFYLEQVQGTRNRIDIKLIAEYVNTLLNHQQQKAA